MTTTTDLLILGASGDLVRRLLLPGLGSLLAWDPERPVRLVGADRADLGTDAFADLCRSSRNAKTRDCRSWPSE